MERQIAHTDEAKVPWKRSVTAAPFEPTRNGALKRVLLFHKDVHSPLMFLNEVYVAPGEQVGRHEHEDMEEIFYFLEGEGIMQLADETQPIGPGDCVIVSAHIPHVVENTGKQEMRFICFGVKEMPDEIWEGRIGKDA
ncbi:MAG TPA: cupin domain-containing protein [Ktedonobacteraceae bacterium]|nr:cupin domain-containing protein [Ktedonobacteraceae bacterium]